MLFDDDIQTKCEQEGMDVDVDCLLSGNDDELTDIPNFELEDNCQGQHGQKMFSNLWYFENGHCLICLIREQVL